MEIVELSSVLGCEARDVDIREPLSGSDAAGLRDAFYRKHALLIRGQALTQEQMERFCDSIWPVHRRTDGTPHWTLITNRGEQAARTGYGILLFHSDHAFAEEPNLGQVLYAADITLPVAPTSFSNMVRAADKLRPELREQLSSQRSVHVIDFECMKGDVTYRIQVSDLPADADPIRYPRWSHPVLLPANPAGDLALYVSEAYSSHVEGVSAEESAAILQECFDVLYAPDNVYEHEWQPHDILLWNNLAVQHGRPKPVVDGLREFWRLKSFAMPGSGREGGTSGRSALDLYTDYAASVKG